MNAVRSFQASEVVIATGLAVIIEATLAILLVTATNHTRIKPKDDVAQEPEPIEVKPVLDDVPLLKLGSKKKLHAKLPDMWVKKPPVRRYEAASAPSPKAEPVKEKIPETPLVKPSAQPPPPDAAIAKKVEEVTKTPPDAGRPKKVVESNLPTEGAEDGVKEGTETDPLKAFAVSQYRNKISAWFNQKFVKPTKEIPCEELKKLHASVTVNVSGDRAVSGYSVSKPSGNDIFDGRVKSTLDGIVSSGAELPPPPPNYADILGSTLAVGFHVASCE
ncbi:MAG TPA: TonB C-terminal domain-containing protein [Polyangiaceae bacterium]|nr:TonB C-terminal domain-containing protein [Polyangiaceae bacterium]